MSAGQAPEPAGLRGTATKLLGTLVVFNGVLVALALAFAIGGVALIRDVRRREQSLESRMAAGARIATERARGFTRRRIMLEPIASGPVDKLEQAIRLMQLMSDEQIALLEQTGGIRSDVAASATEHPAASAGERPAARSARKPGRRD